MALPTQADVRPVDPVLTNLSFGFKNKEYFWDKVAPPVGQPEQTGTFFTWDRDYWLRRATGGSRAPSTGYNRLDFGVSTDTYRALEIGWETPLDEVIMAASQTPESLSVQATSFLTEMMLIELEKLVAAACFVTGVWGTTSTLTSGNQWSDFANSDPISDAKTARRTIRRNTGTEPNSLFIGALTWEKLAEHPLLLEKHKFTHSGLLTKEMVAQDLEVDQLYVMSSIENTAAEGATFSGSDIWTDNALFLNVTPTPGLMVANGAYTFIWDEKGNVPWAMESYNQENIRSLIHRIFTHQVVKICSSQFGYIFLDTNA